MRNCEEAMTDTIAKMINTGIKFCRQKVMLTSTGDDEVDEALKEAFLRDYRHTGANEMWRPHVKKVMAWMQDKNAKDEQDKGKRERDKHPLFEPAKGGER